MALEFVQGQNLSLGTVFTITWAHGLNSREDSMNVDTEELVVRQLMMQIDLSHVCPVLSSLTVLNPQDHGFIHIQLSLSQTSLPRKEGAV